MACAKALGKDLKKPTAPRKRKLAQRRDVVHFEQAEPVKSLTNMCIDVSHCRLLEVQSRLKVSYRSSENISMRLKRLEILALSTWIVSAKLCRRVVDSMRRMCSYSTT